MLRQLILDFTMWVRRHPVFSAVCAAGLVVALVSPSPAMVWADVLVCVGALVCAVVLERRGGARPSPTAVNHTIVVQSEPVPKQVPRPRAPLDGLHPLSMARETEETASPDVTRLTDAELCRAWRASYVRLRRLGESPRSSAVDVVAVACERGLYLDELQRRHPAGFSAWIAAGARAPGNPLPYLRPGSRSRGEIDPEGPVAL